MNPQPRIGPRSEVALHLSLTLEDGTEAVSTFDDEPLRFRMGDGTLVEGLELGLIGLSPGDRQTLQVEPQYAFGPRQADYVQVLDPGQFPKDMELRTGLIVGFTGPEGNEVAGTILAISEQGVRVDFNHPLAGHELTYQVEILEVANPADPDAG